MYACFRTLWLLKFPKHILNPSGYNVLVLKRPGFFIPPSQYDPPPLSPRLIPWKVHKHNKEVLPVLGTIAFAFCIFCFFMVYLLRHKVDVVYFSHNSEDNISHQMNLCRPEVHKLITINQKYEPWPEMQMVLDRMKDAEKQR